MGDYAEMILDGTLCACGCAIDRSRGLSPGYPRYCDMQCEHDYGGAGASELVSKVPKTNPCPECGKMCRGPAGVKQHMKDKHGITTGARG